MGAETSVDCNCRPLVIEQPSVRSADINHRLNREHHAFTQPRPVSARSIIGNLRLFVQASANSVPHELSNHAESVGFDHFLNGRAYVPDRAPDTRCLNRALEGRLSHVEQLLDLRLHVITYRNCDCRVRIVAVEHHAAIDRYNVTLFKQTLLGGDAMYDLLIHRGAQHAGIIVVPLECRLSPKFLNLRRRDGFKIHRGNARLNHRHSGVKYLTHNAPATAHLFNLARRLAHDGHSGHARAQNRIPHRLVSSSENGIGTSIHEMNVAAAGGTRKTSGWPLQSLYITYTPR